MNEFIRKEWRNLMWMIGLIISGIVVLKTSVADVKLMKPKVEFLERFQAEQGILNMVMDKKLDRIEEKLDRIIFKTK